MPRFDPQTAELDNVIRQATTKDEVERMLFDLSEESVLLGIETGRVFGSRN